METHGNVIDTIPGLVWSARNEARPPAQFSNGPGVTRWILNDPFMKAPQSDSASAVDSAYLIFPAAQKVGTRGRYRLEHCVSASDFQPRRSA